MIINLSPYEKDRIVSESFGQTEMGRDLLAQDYMLKQITASLIYPEDAIGKQFWTRIYEEAAKKFGTTNIPVNTFNKVWIVPEKAVVYENVQAGTAYVVESKLKVMLEEDYLAAEKNQRQPGDMFRSEQQRTCPQADCQANEALKVKATQVNTLSQNIVREIIIPQLTKEVNQGQNFAQLRQVYNSLILATWYKKKIKDSILSQVYVDKNKVMGVTYNSSVIARSPKGDEAIFKRTTNKNKIASLPAVARNDTGNDAELIYQRYLQAFKKGAYNYIKEDQDPISKQLVPRKYFSGGVKLFDQAMAVSTRFIQTLPADTPNQAQVVKVVLDRAMSMDQKDFGLDTVIDLRNSSEVLQRLVKFAFHFIQELAFYKDTDMALDGLKIGISIQEGVQSWDQQIKWASYLIFGETLSEEEFYVKLKAERDQKQILYNIRNAYFSFKAIAQLAVSGTSFTFRDLLREYRILLQEEKKKRKGDYDITSDVNAQLLKRALQIVIEQDHAMAVSTKAGAGPIPWNNKESSGYFRSIKEELKLNDLNGSFGKAVFEDKSYMTETAGKSPGGYDLIRVGHLLFLDADRYANLSPTLREQIRQNTILIRNMRTSDFGNEGPRLKSFTTAVMLQLMNTDVQGKLIFDIGAGQGILALVAAKLGASRSVLIDLDQGALDRAKENFELNGHKDQEDFFIFRKDVKDATGILEHLKAINLSIEAEAVFISNIGNWPIDYGATISNSLSIDLIAPVERLLPGRLRITDVMLGGYELNYNRSEFTFGHAPWGDIEDLSAIGFQKASFRRSHVKEAAAVSLRRKNRVMNEELPKLKRMGTAIDRAMNGVKGGIDFQADKINLETKGGNDNEQKGTRNEYMSPFVNPAMLQKFKDAQGFEPNIISIEPLGDVRAFLQLL